VNDQPTTGAADRDLFLQAAWAHATSFLRDKGHVPDVMILGRFEDEQLLLVFPSGQEREAFMQACIAQAAEFGADIAMMAHEAVLDGRGASTEIVAVHWRERGSPIRAQYAVLLRNNGTPAQIGPVSSLSGPQENEFLERVFGEATH
jgi:hypothetical protein